MNPHIFLNHQFPSLDVGGFEGDQGILSSKLPYQIKITSFNVWDIRSIPNPIIFKDQYITFYNTRIGGINYSMNIWRCTVDKETDLSSDAEIKEMVFRYQISYAFIHEIRGSLRYSFYCFLLFCMLLSKNTYITSYEG